MDPNNLTPEQAYKIARHHLGKYLHGVTPVGSGYDVLIRLKGGGYTSLKAGGYTSVSTSETEDLHGMCRNAAALLRLDGWTPTHERLEWEPNGNRLFLLTGRARFPVATYLLPTLDVLIHEVPSQPWHRAGTVAEMVEHIAGWVEDNLPYYLPPFPEPSNA